MKKDPGIPNLFPYKDKLLHEIEEKSRLRDEERLRTREEAKAARQAPVEVQNAPEEGEDEDAELSSLLDEDMEEDQPVDSSNPMSALLASARARAAEYDNEPDSDSDETDGDHSISTTLPTSTPITPDTSRHAYDSIFKTVLSHSDFLLYILDARSPLSTRSLETERAITSHADGSTRLLLILNKIDLVPPHILTPWLTHLRRSFPTLPLRANTPAPNAKTYDHKGLTVKATSETLLRALKSYAASQHLKRAITVGVVGYPNVGKSSVINALTSRLSHSQKKSTACPVGAEAGVTTSLREIKLDGKLKILDSPGIVFPSSATAEGDGPGYLTQKQQAAASLTLLSALPPSAITDPVPAISLLLHRLSHSEMTLGPLLEHYGITPDTLVPDRETGDYTTDFLLQVARKRGRLGKGGVPNLNSAAMGVLMDWRDGRVGGWVEAPKEEVASAGGREIVMEWGKEFQLEGLWGGGGEGAEMMEE